MNKGTDMNGASISELPLQNVDLCPKRWAVGSEPKLRQGILADTCEQGSHCHSCHGIIFYAPSHCVVTIGSIWDSAFKILDVFAKQIFAGMFCP